MQRRHPRAISPRIARYLTGALLILLSLAPASAVVAAPASGSAVLSGHVLRNLSAMTRVAAVSPDQPLALTIVLRPRSASALQDAATARLSTASRLTPQQIGSLYAPSSATIDTLANYFTGFGLTASPPPADHLSFQVQGTVAQIEKALGVSLNTYRDSQGNTFYATSNDPSLPTDLAPSVEAILGLNDYGSLQPNTRLVAATNAHTPADFAKAYNLSAGRDGGTGETIGIIGCNAVSLSDTSAFRQGFGLPANSVTIVSVDGGTPPGGNAETTLATEWAGAVAQGASEVVYQSPAAPSGCSPQGVVDGIITATNQQVASVLVLDERWCEGILPSSFINAAEQALSVAALKGQTVVAASGDYGAYACIGDTPAVDYPASSAYVTAVGGTTLSLNSDGTYQGETAWGAESGDCSGPCGGGGGVSQLFTRPWWQDAVNSASGRGLPDVALNADPQTGYEIYWTPPNGTGTLYNQIGGTGIAAAQWAGLIAIADQEAGHDLGWINPRLYGAVASAESSASKPYHDVTIGNNLHYQAVAGWDLATGWGSPDADNFINALVAAGPNPTPPPTPGAGTPTPVPSATPAPNPTEGPPVKNTVYLPRVTNG